MSKWAKDGLDRNPAGFEQAYVVYKQGKVDQLERREGEEQRKGEVSGTLGERSLSGLEGRYSVTLGGSFTTSAHRPPRAPCAVGGSSSAVAGRPRRTKQVGSAAAAGTQEGQADGGGGSAPPPAPAGGVVVGGRSGGRASGRLVQGPLPTSSVFGRLLTARRGQHGFRVAPLHLAFPQHGGLQS